MRVTIRQKNLKITPILMRYIEQKILKPVRRLLKENAASELPILDLEFGRTTLHHRKGKVYHAQANLTLGKDMLRAEVDDEDIRAACDILEEELEEEIRTFKGKYLSLLKRQGRSIKGISRYHPAARFQRAKRVRQEGR